MQLRIKLWKQRKTLKLGSLECAACGARHLFALWQGGVCRTCFAEGKNGAAVDPLQEQMPETLEAVAEMEIRRAAMGISRHRMAAEIGIESSRMLRWAKGHLGPLAQSRTNSMVRRGIAQRFGTEVTA
jgi:hypothetical protein